MELSLVRVALRAHIVLGPAVFALATCCLGASADRRSSDPSAKAKIEAKAAHDALTAWLGQTPYLAGWRTHLDSDKLEQQLRGGADADPAVVADLLRRYSRGTPGLEHRQFVAVRLALRNWLATLTPRVEPGPANASRHQHQPVVVTHANYSPQNSSLARAAAVAPAVPAVDRMPPETSACVMVRHRFLAGIRGPALRPWANLRVPCAPLAAATSSVLSRTQRTAGATSLAEGIFWHSDYAAACYEARQRQALLFISFYDPARSGHEAVRADELARLTAGTRGYRYAFARLPIDYRALDGGREIAMLEHPALAELGGRPGIAIIDYENPAAEHYRHVVSQFPLRYGRPYSAWELTAILDLPPGTLTQRTMIYAVRTHSHTPRSARGLPQHDLLREAAWHSQHQAELSVQGHHNWEGRFHRINAKLGDMASREVVAESWGGQSLLEAAIECVNSWSQSSGHWEAVSSPHAEYGYDIERGSNGVWYATGLFGD